MIWPLDPDTVTEALRVARLLAQSGPEGLAILRELFSSLIDSSQFFKVVQKWFVPWPSSRTPYPRILRERLPRITVELGSSGYLVDAVRLIATGAEMVQDEAIEFEGILQEAVKAPRSKLVPEKAIAAAVGLRSTGMDLLAQGNPEGITLIGTASRLAPNLELPIQEIEVNLGRIEERHSASLEPADAQALINAAYDLHFSGRPNQAVRVGALVPSLLETPDRNRLFRKVMSSAKPGAEAKLRVSTEILEKGYPYQAATLLLDSGAVSADEFWDVLNDEIADRKVDLKTPNRLNFYLRSGKSLVVPDSRTGSGRTNGGEKSEPQSRREITVTGHTLDGNRAFRFKQGETYRLRFRVGPPVDRNLAVGETSVQDVPREGLQTRWIVTSINVEFVPAHSSCKTQKIRGTWVAEFNLLIPEHGSSKIEDLAVVKGSEPGRVVITIYAMSKRGEQEIFRKLSVGLADWPEVIVDAESKGPQYTHLKTAHEWTTPPEHIQVSILNGVASITTKRWLLKNYEFHESFPATDNLISGAIKSVRDSLERLREVHETYLDDLSHSDIAIRLGRDGWQPYSWAPLPDQADTGHGSAFDAVQGSKEWQSLASDGYALFNSCFPENTKLRALLEKLSPGSRIDFHWDDQSGPGWVSHVPWALMHMGPVDVTGQVPAAPEGFLGLRFRIGTYSWTVDRGEVFLGGLDTQHSLHLLYWGNLPQDQVAAEAQWQASEFGKWHGSSMIPDVAKPDFKNQVILTLDKPAPPSPVALIYFYCHCSVGDGNQPVLRFGNTSKRDDTVSRTELSQNKISDAPLIFANACTTSQADPHMTSELEQRFFKRGIRGFIGTETKVPIRLASKFAWLYFQFFLRRVDPDPMPAGEALSQARMFLWTQYKNVGGLFYSMTNQYDLYLASDQEVLALRAKEQS